MAGEFAALHIGKALFVLQGWMMAYLAALAAGIGLLIWLGQTGDASDQAIVAARLGFLTRDMALVVLASIVSRRKSDLAGLAGLFVLYLLLPMILKGLGGAGSLVLFYPQAGEPLWLSPALAWSEAVLATVFAVLSLALPERKAAEE